MIRRWTPLRRASPLAMAIIACVGGLMIPSIHLPLAGAATHNVISSLGCKAKSHLGSRMLSISLGGNARRAIVHVPTSWNSHIPAPLVLNLHGTGSTAVLEESFSGMDSASNQYRFIVIYPQAFIPSGNGFVWNVPNVSLYGDGPIPVGAVNDVGFLKSLVTYVEARYCIDKSRVYASGYSRGGRMSSQLACDGSTIFAAVAVIAGLRLPDPCPAIRPVPIIAFHGSADTVNPYNGSSASYWTYSVPTAAAKWATQDSCSTSSTSSNAGYSLVIYSGCRANVKIELYSVIGEGHEWPGGPTQPQAVTNALGPQSNAVSATSLMWTFFVQHPMVLSR